MQTTVVAGWDAFEEAARRARTAGAAGPLDGLAAPLEGALLGHVDEAWEAIEESLRQAFRAGKDAAAQAATSALNAVRAVLAKAGGQSHRLEQALIARAGVFRASLLHDAVAKLPTTLSIGPLGYGLTSVRFSQKVIVSGSLELSVTKLFELTSSGEIEVGVDYSVVAAPAQVAVG